MFTRASATFLHAEVMIRENVGREILRCLAASSCFSPSRQARRIASNSSRLRVTPSSSLEVLQRGRKHLSPGKHLTQRVFLGLTNHLTRYEHMFIIAICPIFVKRRRLSDVFMLFRERFFEIHPTRVVKSWNDRHPKRVERKDRKTSRRERNDERESFKGNSYRKNDRSFGAPSSYHHSQVLSGERREVVLI